MTDQRSGPQAAPSLTRRSGDQAPRWLQILSIPGMLLVGMIIALQSQINGELGQALGSGPRASALAAVIAFSGAFATLHLLMPFLPRQRARLGHLARAVRERRVPLWVATGGLFGAFFVLTQSVVVGVTGVALFTVAIVVGQTTSALGIDRIGLGPGGIQAVSSARLVAAAMAMLAVVIAAVGSARGEHALSLSALLLLLLPVLSGAGTSMQQAVNGRISVVAGPYAAAWVSTVVGLVVLITCFGLSLLFPGELTGWPPHWWMYTGGVLGSAFIALSAALVWVHGVLALTLCTIAGQMLTAFALNVLDPDQPVTLGTQLATALVLLGVVLAVLVRPRARPTATAG